MATFKHLNINGVDISNPSVIDVFPNEGIEIIDGIIYRNIRPERKAHVSQAAAIKLGEKVKNLTPEEKFLIEERRKNHEYLYGKGRTRYSEEMQLVKAMLLN